MNVVENKQSGFTLIELAIVLVIIAILIGSFISSLTVRIENSQIEQTKNDLAIIKQALIGYAYKNGHLPCPDCINVAGCAGGARDGNEDFDGTGACYVGNGVGTLPWVTLGLARGDAWNTRYRYWVDSVYSTRAPGVVFDLNSANGAGIIQEPDYVTDPTGATLQSMATNVVAVVYSHGKNTYGGYNVEDILLTAIPSGNFDEIANTDADNTFVSRPPTPEDATTAGGEFDDILIWLTEFELKAKMVEAGVLP